jgi:Fe-S-cluster containining protein
MNLMQIQLEVHRRVTEIEAANPHWPCRKGCDDCCRSLAAPPRVTQEEWRRISASIPESDPRRKRIRESANATRPVVCPLLDTGSGSCTVYEMRPIACRAYGFYAERQFVLGCSRIEALAEGTPDIVWGNQTALDARLSSLGESATFAEWQAREE